VALTGEVEGYYRAFADRPIDHLIRSLTEGFAYQGESFPLSGKPRGEPSGHLPPEATVFFAQNHDQVGNRALGERLSMLVDPVKLKQGMGLVLLSPHIPLLFMGEEAAVDTPFLFFADWSDEAAELTRKGRRREFAHFKAFSTADLQERIPDPCDERTFLASKLDWASIERSPRSMEFRALTKELISIRQEKIIPLIQEGFVKAKGRRLGRGDGLGGIEVRWETRRGGVLQIAANFSESELPIADKIEGNGLWQAQPFNGEILLPAQIVVALSQGSRWREL
jgi:maltooligosyltrehalose trehalohydrolase